VTHTLDVAGRTLGAPRTAAVAGVIFSLLMIAAVEIVRSAVPPDPAAPGAWLMDQAKRRAIGFALQLVPFAGIAFLWFIGAVRNRLGRLEDQFFATVVLGSGLMFVASLFSAAAIGTAMLQSGNIDIRNLPTSETYYFERGAVYVFMNVFAARMAAVFMFSTSTIALRTAILPRWVAYTGFVFGLVLLTVITSWVRIVLIFPLWMLLVSAQILAADLRRRPDM